MWRIYNFQNKNNLDEEHFAEHFHQDSYLMNYCKIHINLMDVYEDDGPTEIIPRKIDPLLLNHSIIKIDIIIIFLEIIP